MLHKYFGTHYRQSERYSDIRKGFTLLNSFYSSRFCHVLPRVSGSKNYHNQIWYQLILVIYYASLLTYANAFVLASLYNFMSPIIYTTSNCQAIMNIHLIVKNRCIGGYSAIINLNHKFIITFRTDVDFNINILKTKFPNSFGFQYFCKTTSYRTRGKYQSLNPTSL